MCGKRGGGGKDDRGDSEEGGQPVSGSTEGNTTMDNVSRHRNEETMASVSATRNERHGLHGRGSEQTKGGLGGGQPFNVHSTAS